MQAEGCLCSWQFGDSEVRQAAQDPLLMHFCNLRSRQLLKEAVEQLLSEWPSAACPFTEIAFAVWMRVDVVLGRPCGCAEVD